MAIELITGHVVEQVLEVAATSNHPEAGNIKIRLKGDRHVVWMAPKQFKPSPELELAIRQALKLEP